MHNNANSKTIYVVVRTHHSGLCYKFSNSCTLAAHTLFNGHHEHTTFYITVRKYTHKTGNISWIFLHVFLRAKWKQKRSFLISFTVQQKVSNIFSVAHNVYNKYTLFFYLHKSLITGNFKNIAFALITDFNVRHT